MMMMMMIGVLYDVTGSYDIGFTVAGILIIISGLMLIPVSLMNKQAANAETVIEPLTTESKSPPPVIVVSSGDGSQ